MTISVLIGSEKSIVKIVPSRLQNWLTKFLKFSKSIHYAKKNLLRLQT